MNSAREIVYLSPPAAVSMADRWYDIASVDHFWVRRRFEVLRRLAGPLIGGASEMAEIGCGSGLVQRQIEDHYGRKITGFDLNEYALKRNLSRLSPVCCYNIYERGPTLRGKFDLILLFDVLEHIADEDRFLAAIRHHLAPGGKLIVNVPAGQCLYSAYDRADGHVRRYSFTSLRKAAQRAGFEVSQWSYWGFPLVPLVFLRKLRLAGKRNDDEIITLGFDARSRTVDRCLGLLAQCESVPQHLAGTSLMAVLWLKDGTAAAAS